MHILISNQSIWNVLNYYIYYDILILNVYYFRRILFLEGFSEINVLKYIIKYKWGFLHLFFIFFVNFWYFFMIILKHFYKKYYNIYAWNNGPLFSPFVRGKQKIKTPILWRVTHDFFFFIIIIKALINVFIIYTSFVITNALLLIFFTKKK